MKDARELLMLGGVRDYSRGVVAHLNICNLFSERRLGRRSGFVVAPCYVSFNRSVMVEMSNSGMAVHISALSVLETRLLVQSMTSHGRSEEHTSELQLLRHLVCR